MAVRRVGVAVALVCILAGLTIAVAAQQKGGPASFLDDPGLAWVEKGAFKFWVAQSGRIRALENPVGDSVLKTENSDYKLCTTEDTYQATSLYGFHLSPGGLYQPGGPGTSPLSVTAHSWDGKWEIKWTYSVDTAENDLVLTAAVKRLFTWGGGVMTYLEIGYDFDVSHATEEDVYDHDRHRTWQRSADSPENSMTMLSLSQSLTHWMRTTSALGIHEPGCNPADLPTLPGFGDAASVATHDLGAVSVGSTKKVQISLRRQ